MPSSTLDLCTIAVRVVAAVVVVIVEQQLLVVSIEPRDGHPLWRRLNQIDCILELCNRLADVVVHDRQVEKVAISVLQHVRLLAQPLQASIVLLEQKSRNEKLRKKNDLLTLTSAMFCRSGAAMKTT